MARLMKVEASENGSDCEDDSLESLEDAENGELSPKEVEKRIPEPLDEDAYGLGIVSLIRDTELLISGTDFKRVRIVRFATSMAIMLMVVALQMFLLYEVKENVATPAVHEARDVYDEYEVHMYGNETGHTILTVNGKHRGIREFFRASQFNTLPEKLRKSACSIPLSQPRYFGTILLIWTLTCIADLARAINQLSRLLCGTPTISSMKHATQISEDDETQLIVVGITAPLKVFIGVIFFVRIVMTIILLWLGCRWLAATESFADILLNAVALEFILLLKELLYNSMVPSRSRRETANTLILPIRPKEKPRVSVLLGSFLWGFVAVAWVWVYIYHLQRVLPQYNWDVAGPCSAWLQKKYHS